MLSYVILFWMLKGLMFGEQAILFQNQSWEFGYQNTFIALKAIFSSLCEAKEWENTPPSLFHFYGMLNFFTSIIDDPGQARTVIPLMVLVACVLTLAMEVGWYKVTSYVLSKITVFVYSLLKWFGCLCASLWIENSLCSL